MSMSIFIPVLICGWIIISTTVTGTAFDPWLRKDHLQGYDFGTDITFTTYVRDSRACVMSCMWQRERCRSVTFDSSTATCIGYDASFATKSGGSTNVNTVYYASVECQDPPDVNNASASAGSNTFGSVRMYECDPGYITSGDPSTTCLLDESWSPVNFTCTQAVCGSPPAVSRTVVSQIGTVYHYECDKGYVETGSVTSTACQSDGQYSAMDITCNDCNTYAPSWSHNPDKYFNPPGFRPSYSGSTITLAYCMTNCENRNDIDCVAIYYRNSTNYCALQKRRVHDDPSYPQYYTTDVTFQEYIRNCFN